MMAYTNWTKEELYILGEIFPKHGPTGSMSFLPGRSAGAIAHKASFEGIEREPVESPEPIKPAQPHGMKTGRLKPDPVRFANLKKLISERYREEGPDNIAAETGYSRQRVLNVASSMGVNMTYRAKRISKSAKRTTRRVMESKHSDIERLALYKPWRNYPREKRERLYRV